MRLNLSRRTLVLAASLLAAQAAAQQVSQVSITVKNDEFQNKHFLFSANETSTRTSIPFDISVGGGVFVEVTHVELWRDRGRNDPQMFLTFNPWEMASARSLSVPQNSRIDPFQISIRNPTDVAVNVQFGRKPQTLYLQLYYSQPNDGLQSVKSTAFGISNLNLGEEFDSYARSMFPNPEEEPIGGIATPSGGAAPTKTSAGSSESDAATASSTSRTAFETSASSGQGQGQGQGSTSDGEGSQSGSGTAAASSDTGLSTAAIAGIAVGAGIAVLILASALAFFLLRKRRDARAAAGDSSDLGYSPHGHHGSGRSAEIIAEKEANAGVAESPHSPYSDDGQRDSGFMVAGAGTVGAAIGAGPGTPVLMSANNHMQHHPFHNHHQAQVLGYEQDFLHRGNPNASIGTASSADFMPYSDHPSPPMGSTGIALSTPRSSTAFAMAPQAAGSPSTSIATGPAPAAAGVEDELQQQQPSTPVSSAAASRAAVAAALPRAGTGMSGRYAHLVEDGMTTAEIARMEEEERELDAAIDRARGVTTK